MKPKHLLVSAAVGCVGAAGREPGVQWEPGAEPGVQKGRVCAQEPPRWPETPGGDAASALPRRT